MIYINEGEIGLGKSKVLRSIQIKKVSLKNAVKVVKFAAPIAAGFIPVGGGVASKLTSKVLNSKVGKVVSKAAKSKVGAKVIALSKTKVGTAIINQAKPAVNKTIQEKLVAIKHNGKPKSKKQAKKLAKGSKGAEVKKLQESLGIEADGVFGPKTEVALQKATGAKSVTVNEASSPYANETQSDSEPVGELTPVKPIEKAVTQITEEVEPVGELTPVTQKTASAMESNFNSAEPAKKDNTMLYVGGAVALGAIAYLATKKSK